MPKTMHLRKDYTAVCALLMLLGGCVYPRAVAPETSSTTTPAPPTTPPSPNAPALIAPPQSAAQAASSNASVATPTLNRQSSPVAEAVTSSKSGAAKPVAKNVPPASPKTLSSAGEGGSGVPAPPAAATTAPTQTARPVVVLDLASLEQRLRDTHAIGIFTKLSLKNQVDDLLAHFKSFHHGQVPPTLPQLRQDFELLLIKVVTVLQDGDATLASAVSTSREALWSILSDPQKFAKI
jgi:hypothetical protein